MTTVGYVEAVLLRQGGELLVATAQFEGFFGLLVVHIADALVVEERRDVVLEVVLTYRSTEDVTSLKDEVVKLLSCRLIIYIRHKRLIKS